MNLIAKFFTDTCSILTLILLVCILTLIGTYSVEYYFDLKPCVLCLYQRYVYMIVAGIAFLGTTLNLRPFILLCGLGFLSGALIAFYQVGVEQHIFPLPEICKVTHATISVQDLKAQLMQKPVIPCDKVTWEYLGISMAGYNGLFSTILFLYAFLTFRRSRS